MLQKLGCCQVGLAYVPDERCRISHAFVGAPAVEPHQPNGFADALAHHPQGFNQIRILREHERDIEMIRPSVVDEMNGEIDVRAFLLGVENLDDALR